MSFISHSVRTKISTTASCNAIIRNHRLTTPTATNDAVTSLFLPNRRSSSTPAFNSALTNPIRERSIHVNNTTFHNFVSIVKPLLFRNHPHHRRQHHHRFTTFTKSEYIHPLSQIVLEHLQSHHGMWVQKMGLDQGLELKKDGTFVLRFPTDATCNETKDKDMSPDDNDSSKINGSIWTIYEPEEKKHFLCITKGNLIGRYLLQDNKKPAWHSDKRSTPERVQDAVDEMIVKIEDCRTNGV